MKFFKGVRSLFPKRTCGCYLDAVTGVQIDPAEQEMLFDRLYPAGPSRAAGPEQQQKRSLGFGLAIANGIIQAHNGRMWIESTGEGEQVQSTFYLLLPILA